MKKAVTVTVVLVGLAVLARRFGPKMRAIDWEKRVWAMPGNTRPRWMFRNITAIRENTYRILELDAVSRSMPVRARMRDPRD